MDSLKYEFEEQQKRREKESKIKINQQINLDVGKRNSVLHIALFRLRRHDGKERLESADHQPWLLRPTQHCVCFA
jgi:hypothetical protein